MDDLIRAQFAGEVVFVVGAGVSRRVGLPLFGELVAQVYARVGQACPGAPGSLADVAETDAWGNGEWDRTLGLLEHRLVYASPNRLQADNIVRQAVADILKPTRRVAAPHGDILQISRDAHGRPRVVTTNFDMLFERAWKADRSVASVSFVGPGLPAVGSPAFEGIMHLHGRVGDPRLRVPASNLVLTSSDFGEAYLRSGWASRFVYDLLRRYTLVFVGYAADDPPMRYMLEATEAGRLHFPDLRHAYAFAPFGEHAGSDEGSVYARWRAKGLVPVLYENSDHSYENLYGTLTAWAGCTRDPANWAEAEIRRLVGTPITDASPLVRAKVTFLTRAMTNATVLSKYAGSATWIDCLVDTKAPSPLDDRDALIWINGRLDSAEMVSWALAASPELQSVIARAVAANLSVPRAGSPQNEVFRHFWGLYTATFDNRRNRLNRLRRVTHRDAGQADRIDYFRMVAVAEHVRPRLQINKPFPLSAFGREAEPSEPSLRDLCNVSFACDEWPSWPELLAGWPADSDAEYRLLQALSRMLADACELAREAQFITPEFDTASRSVQLVHALTAAEADVPQESDASHGDHWQRTDADAHDHSFVPIVRLMSGLWRRLEERDPARARAVASGWIEQDFVLFRRLGFWAAAASPHGPIARAAELLSGLSRDDFWLENRTAEAARFWCARWNKLPFKTRRVMEGNILKGPKFEWLWLAEPKHKRRVADSMRRRELARIATAGGKLSTRAQAALTRLTSNLEHAAARVSVVDGLQQESWSGSGRMGDASLVSDTPVEQLLERIDAIEEADSINQDGLWAKVCSERPDAALGALTQSGRSGNWPARRWREFLSQTLIGFNDRIDEAQVIAVADALALMPDETLATVLPTVGVWLKSLVHADWHAGLRPIILRAWDRLMAGVIILPEDEQRRRGGQPDLAHESLNHPAGDVATVLITVQDKSPKAEAGGLAADLAPRFEQVLQIPGAVRILALVRLAQALRFFMWLAPVWAEEHLCREFDRGDDDARQLLAMLFIYGRPYSVQIFNRLKPLICGSLVDPGMTENARDRLAQFITWIIGLKMAGNNDVNLTEAEARQLLTRSPPSGLRSVAWGLWRSLLPEEREERREEEPQRDLWRERIKPFLERVWPNDVVARDAKVSNMLIKIPAATGPHLPEAVALITRLIVPGTLHSAIYDLGLHEKEQLIDQFPRELLGLAHAAIDFKEPMPYDLPQFLQLLVDAAAELRDDPRYAALLAACRRFQ